MSFDQLTVATTLRIVCNAYLCSCLLMIGFSYLGYLILNHFEKFDQKQHFHWFG